MTVLILFFLLVLIVSFLCSLLEASILSMSLAHAALLARQGRKSGQLLMNLKNRINRPLAAILTLNTVANTLGAAGVGAQTLHLFGSKWVALASGILTLCILILSEIVPKTIGAVYWKPLAPFTAYAVRTLIILVYPLVVVIEGISQLIANRSKYRHMTREEMAAAAKLGEDAGELLRRERRIIDNLLRLNTIYASDILTPRSVLFALPRGRTVGEVMNLDKPLLFSRIPIYGENLDDIVGMVYRLDILRASAKGRDDATLEALSRPIHVIPVTKTVASVLHQFIQRRDHLFLVVDEYGGTAGIVTLEDAIETLLGVEIMDESDAIEDMQAYAREKWARRQKSLQPLDEEDDPRESGS